tara:strand:- start:2110 stop:2349 length:240 start_codon:yes stop_codon:yes gene_type:complete
MDKATKIKALEKKAKDRERQKKKSCKPPKDSAYIDPINQPFSTGIKTSLSGICSPERWEEIFGKKNKEKTNKKKSSKKT